MAWDYETINLLIQKQRSFFKTGKTLDVSWRIQQLKKLKASVLKHEEAIEKAMLLDLGRSKEEAYLCDIGPVVMEINEAIHGLRKWSRTEYHYSGLPCFPSIITKVHKLPYGVTLIIAPFNFPFMLSIGVLAAAVSGGNTAVIKASSKSPNCTEVLGEIISDAFPEEYIKVVDGGHDVADICLAQRFDKIFYTGSPKVARHVLSEAADHLIPVGLELGGENGNWCIIRKDADLKDAASKIAFFKLCNSGQICININQIAIAEEIAEDFIAELKAAFIKQIGENASANPEYPCLITDAAWKKCADEADHYRQRIVFGGEGCQKSRKYNPTIIYPVAMDEPIVNHELFNPLLPVVPYKDSEIDSVIETIESREHPLALYLFTKDKKWADKIMATCQYGGGCINEVCIQLMVKGAPFNGTGHSGMGAYHGEWGFREFTHPSTVLVGHSHFNLPLRYHPYTSENNAKLSMLKLFER